jgi:hypothetical protein
MRETFEFAEKSKIDYVKFFIANVFNGTKLYDYAVANNFISDDGYNDNDISWRYSRVKSEDWTPEEVSFLRLYEWDRINFTDPIKKAKTAKMMNITIEALDDIRRNSRKILQNNFYPVINEK